MTPALPAGIAQRLAQRALSLRALARESGMSHSALSRALHGRSRVTPRLLAAIAGPLGYTPNELRLQLAEASGHEPQRTALPGGGPGVDGEAGPAPDEVQVPLPRPGGHEQPAGARPSATDAPLPDGSEAAGCRISHPMSSGEPDRSGNATWQALRALGVEPSVNAVRVQAQLIRLAEYAATAEAQQLVAEGLARKIAALGARGPVIERLRHLAETYLHDTTAPEPIRTVAGSAVLYFLLGVDDIDDYLFPIGYLDDAVAVSLVDAEVQRLRLVHGARPST